MTSPTAKLSPEQAETLRGQLAKRDFDTAAVPHAVYSFKRPGLSVTWYESGKLLAQGKGTREFVEFTLEPEVLGQDSAQRLRLPGRQFCGVAGHQAEMGSPTGSTHLSCSRMRSTRLSTASASGMLNRTGSRPT